MLSSRSSATHDAAERREVAVQGGVGAFASSPRGPKPARLGREVRAATTPTEPAAAAAAAAARRECRRDEALQRGATLG